MLVGGKLPDQSKGLFYPPTVITGVTRGMRIWEEEVFGPVMTVVPFDTEDEAIALANDCPFGLGSAVFSRSAARARRVGAQLEVGWGMGGTVLSPNPAPQQSSAQRPAFLVAGRDDEHQRFCDDVHVPVPSLWRRQGVWL